MGPRTDEQSCPDEQSDLTQNPNMCTPFWENVQNDDLNTSYLDNPYGRNEKLIGFGMGVAPRAQIRGVFVSTKGVSEIISILVEIVRR